MEITLSIFLTDIGLLRVELKKLALYNSDMSFSCCFFFHNLNINREALFVLILASQNRVSKIGQKQTFKELHTCKKIWKNMQLCLVYIVKAVYAKRESQIFELIQLYRQAAKTKPLSQS